MKGFAYMKRHTVLGAVLLIGCIAVFLNTERPALLGFWESGDDAVCFDAGGRCEIDGEKAVFRLEKDGHVRVFRRGHSSEVYPYMVSFDRKSMYFDGQRYVKTAQSGAERSIIELLLRYSPESLS